MELQYIMRTIIEICIILQIMTFSQTSRVGNAKIQIRNLAGAELAEVRHEVKRVRHSLGLDKPRRYSSKRKLGATFSLWSTWSICDNTCIKRRERYCKMKNICGYTKQIEEQMCKNCLFHPSLKYSPLLSSDQQYSLQPFKHNNNNNNWENTGRQIPIKIQSHTEDDDGSNKYRDESDYYIIRKKNKRNRKRKKKKPIILEFDDYEDIDEDVIDNISDDNYDDDNDTPKIKIRSNKFFRGGRGGRGGPGGRGGYSNYDKYYRRHRNRFIPREQKNLYENFDDFYYDDNDFFEDRSDHQIGGMLNDNDENFDNNNNNNQYNKNTTKFSPKEKAVIELPSRYKKIYSKWSKWTKCSSKCTSRRYKKCKVKEVCGKEVLREIAYCYTEGSFCQQWLQTHIQKTPPYDINPINYDRKDQDHSINLVAEDYIISGKGYQSPEYAPLKLKCGIPSIRKSMNNMLKIIGGKVSRKGEWPWQVGIFNRFKEIFCGGTLIAPQWVLTAAHCVRKVLYVRLGEHNLDIEDGTEIEFRVSKSFKHPNYDKSTVDSDIALLKLPKPVNSTSWIGFSCMPRPFQPLPKNIQCTVIGWGKRRNRDQSGTSILHQAEVPIISMDHCKAVYYDYTITKNMFCAGHKRGRIDTCAGDSGGPLLCRDTTKSNHPWTIFGITSFGDGCAKKNKFGIYAKVPNYVDWVWSVINCNGNCKPKRRT